jgi:four helix bundle protein
MSGNENRMDKPAKTFRDLLVWQKAHRFVLAIYRLTKGFPADERFGLTSQIRRAAVSVAANIAEGFIKRSRAEKARFFNISQGSLEEVHYYLILGNDLGYSGCTQLADSYREVARLLNGYTRAILTPDS